MLSRFKKIIENRTNLLRKVISQIKSITVTCIFIESVNFLSSLTLKEKATANTSEKHKSLKRSGTSDVKIGVDFERQVLFDLFSLISTR